MEFNRGYSGRNRNRNNNTDRNDDENDRDLSPGDGRLVTVDITDDDQASSSNHNGSEIVDLTDSDDGVLVIDEDPEENFPSLDGPVPVIRLNSASAPASTAMDDDNNTTTRMVITDPGNADGLVKKPTGSRRKRRATYLCSVCNKVFDAKPQLIIHMRAHTGEKPFDCDKCEKKFTQRGNLNRHKMVHFEYTPLQCSRCDHKCATRDEMSHHTQTHLGERPFTCHICSKAFTQKGNKNRHMLVHLDHKPLQCTLCEYRCKRRDQMTHHMRIHFDTEQELKTYLARYGKYTIYKDDHVVEMLRNQELADATPHPAVIARAENRKRQAAGQNPYLAKRRLSENNQQHDVASTSATAAELPSTSSTQLPIASNNASANSESSGNHISRNNHEVVVGDQEDAPRYDTDSMSNQATMNHEQLHGSQEFNNSSNVGLSNNSPQQVETTAMQQQPSTSEAINYQPMRNQIVVREEQETPRHAADSMSNAATVNHEQRELSQDANNTSNFGMKQHVQTTAMQQQQSTSGARNCQPMRNQARTESRPEARSPFVMMDNGRHNGPLDQTTQLQLRENNKQSSIFELHDPGIHQRQLSTPIDIRNDQRMVARNQVAMGNQERTPRHAADSMSNSATVNQEQLQDSQQFNNSSNFGHSSSMPQNVQTTAMQQQSITSGNINNQPIRNQILMSGQLYYTLYNSQFADTASLQMKVSTDNAPEVEAPANQQQLSLVQPRNGNDYNQIMQMPNRTGMEGRPEARSPFVKINKVDAITELQLRENNEQSSIFELRNTGIHQRQLSTSTDSRNDQHMIARNQVVMGDQECNPQHAADSMSNPATINDDQQALSQDPSNFGSSRSMAQVQTTAMQQQPSTTGAINYQPMRNQTLMSGAVSNSWLTDVAPLQMQISTDNAPQDEATANQQRLSLVQALNWNNYSQFVQMPNQAGMESRPEASSSFVMSNKVATPLQLHENNEQSSIFELHNLGIHQRQLSTASNIRNDQHVIARNQVVVGDQEVAPRYAADSMSNWATVNHEQLQVSQDVKNSSIFGITQQVQTTAMQQQPSTSGTVNHQLMPNQTLTSGAVSNSWLTDVAPFRMQASTDNAPQDEATANQQQLCLVQTLNWDDYNQFMQMPNQIVVRDQQETPRHAANSMSNSATVNHEQLQVSQEFTNPSNFGSAQQVETTTMQQQPSPSGARNHPPIPHQDLMSGDESNSQFADTAPLQMQVTTDNAPQVEATATQQQLSLVQALNGNNYNQFIQMPNQAGMESRPEARSPFVMMDNKELDLPTELQDHKNKKQSSIFELHDPGIHQRQLSTPIDIRNYQRVIARNKDLMNGEVSNSQFAAVHINQPDTAPSQKQVSTDIAPQVEATATQQQLSLVQSLNGDDYNQFVQMPNQDLMNGDESISQFAAVYMNKTDTAPFEMQVSTDNAPQVEATATQQQLSLVQPRNGDSYNQIMQMPNQCQRQDSPTPHHQHMQRSPAPAPASNNDQMRQEAMVSSDNAQVSNNIAPQVDEPAIQQQQLQVAAGNTVEEENSMSKHDGKRAGLRVFSEGAEMQTHFCIHCRCLYLDTTLFGFHVINHNINTPFQCNFCDAISHNIDQWHAHQMLHRFATTANCIPSPAMAQQLSDAAMGPNIQTVFSADVANIYLHHMMYMFYLRALYMYSNQQ